MIVSIHQPNYLPYLGFFDKIKKSDIFIVYDDAQFNKGDFQHRNKIRIYSGWKWLTIPVEKKHIPINQVKIKNEVNIGKKSWNMSHFDDICDSYKRSPYYEPYIDGLELIYKQQYNNLFDINMDLIKFFLKSFDIKTRIVLSSDYGLTSKSTDKLVELVDSVGGDIYLSGPMGRHYLECEKFSKRNIDVLFQDFAHPIYLQQFKDFIPNMSAIDALFNMGKMQP